MVTTFVLEFAKATHCICETTELYGYVYSFYRFFPVTHTSVVLKFHRLLCVLMSAVQISEGNIIKTSFDGIRFVEAKLLKVLLDCNFYNMLFFRNESISTITENFKFIVGKFDAIIV